MVRLTIRPAYTVRELAVALAVDRRTLRRVLEHHGVEVIGDAKFSFVSLAEIERKIPSLFDGIKLADSLHESLEDRHRR